MKLATLEAWMSAHARNSMNDLRMAFDQVGDHERRGPLRSYDAVTRQVPENPPDKREVRIEPVPGTGEEFYVYMVEGMTEDRLTMTRASIGTQQSNEGLYRALREILGDPPGWPRAG